MGTNYYLKLKCNYNEECPTSLGISPIEVVQHLTNGYVYNNTYYKTIEDLNKDYYRIFHIGKSSYGWKFLLCTYQNHITSYGYTENYVDKAILNLKDWRELFNDKNNIIYDETDKIITPENMINIITHPNSELLYSREPDKFTKIIPVVNYDLIKSGNDIYYGVIFS